MYYKRCWGTLQTTDWCFNIWDSSENMVSIFVSWIVWVFFKTPWLPLPHVRPPQACTLQTGIPSVLLPTWLGHLRDFHPLGTAGFSPPSLPPFDTLPTFSQKVCSLWLSPLGCCSRVFVHQNWSHGLGCCLSYVSFSWDHTVICGPKVHMCCHFSQAQLIGFN